MLKLVKLFYKRHHPPSQELLKTEISTEADLRRSLENLLPSAFGSPKCLEIFRFSGIGSGLTACSLTCKQGLLEPCGHDSAFGKDCPHGYRVTVVCIGQW